MTYRSTPAEYPNLTHPLLGICMVSAWIESVIDYSYLYRLEHSNSGKKVSIRFSLPNRFFRFDSAI